MSEPSLLAAIDVGTNSFHILIAAVNARGMYTIKGSSKESVRLGETGGDMKYLSAEAIGRGVSTLKRFATMAHNSGATIRAVATSAVREALNRKVFLQRVYHETGIRIEVISGAEEARMIYLGVAQALPVFDKKTLVIDIGGGSTETTIGMHGDILHAHSAKLGAIRLTRRFFPTEHYNTENLKACRNHIRGEWSSVFRKIRKEGFDLVVGSSGTIQTLISIALAKETTPADQINGAVVTRESITEVVEYIAKTKSYSKRAEIAGMDPRRADIIIGGALILEQAMLGLELNELTFSACALREGILLDTIQKQRDIRKHHHLSTLRFASVLNMCEHCQVDMLHARHVAKLALKFFDDLQPLHKYTEVQRELLEAAAYLHDVGYQIAADQHHKHSFYILRNAVMLGFTDNELEVIANIARYHRKSHPKMKHENFVKLEPDVQECVCALAGILRIAEGLDRQHRQLAQSVSMRYEGDRIECAIEAQDPQDLNVELWGAERKKTLLESTTKKKIRFSVHEPTRQLEIPLHSEEK